MTCVLNVGGTPPSAAAFDDVNEDNRGEAVWGMNVVGGWVGGSEVVHVSASLATSSLVVFASQAHQDLTHTHVHWLALTHALRNYGTITLQVRILSGSWRLTQATSTRAQTPRSTTWQTRDSGGLPLLLRAGCGLCASRQLTATGRS